MNTVFFGVRGQGQRTLFISSWDIPPAQQCCEAAPQTGSRWVRDTREQEGARQSEGASWSLSTGRP